MPAAEGMSEFFSKIPHSNLDTKRTVGSKL